MNKALKIAVQLTPILPPDIPHFLDWYERNTDYLSGWDKTRKLWCDLLLILMKEDETNKCG